MESMAKMGTHYRHPKGRNEIQQKKISIGTYEIEGTDPKVTIQRIGRQYEYNWILICNGMTRTEIQKSFHIQWLAEVKRGHEKSPVKINFH